MFSDNEVKAALKMFHVIRAFDELEPARRVGLALWDESTLRAVRNLYEAWDEAFGYLRADGGSAFNGFLGELSRAFRLSDAIFGTSVEKVIAARRQVERQV